MKKYIKVDYNQKDEVKGLGARWDTELKSWYIPDDADESKFSKWSRFDPTIKLDKTYLFVPFDEKDQVKAAGARWDSDKKQWYFLSDQDSSKFKKWIASGDADISSSNVNKEEVKPKATEVVNKYDSDDLASDLDSILGLDE